MARYIALICIYFLSFSQVEAQDLKRVQYGFAVKATIDFNGLENYFKHSNFNVSVTGGAGFHPFEASFVYPSIHMGFLLFNQGNPGAPYNQGFFKSTRLNLFSNFTITSGVWRNNINHQLRRVPLYHFGDFTANPLLNPFQHSLGLGTNLIFFLDKYKDGYQRIGFGNILIDRHFQFNMLNDGSIFAILNLADGYDRYFTGGGQFSWHQDATNWIDSFELSFMKHTGYEPLTFETSNLLQSDFISFQNKKTIYYSTNRLRFRVNSTQDNLSLHFTMHNMDVDFQDIIHLSGDWTFFPDIFTPASSLVNDFKRSGFGASYNYFYNRW